MGEKNRDYSHRAGSGPAGRRLKKSALRHVIAVAGGHRVRPNPTRRILSSHGGCQRPKSETPMIKKIAAERLKPGMFIHDLDCGWMAHPFLRSRFTLRSEIEIEKIAGAGIHEVYIDTDKGLDAADAPSEREVALSVEREMLLASQSGAAAEPSDDPIQAFERARRVRAEACGIIRDVMKSVRAGGEVSVARVEPVVEKVTDAIFRNNGALVSLCRVKDKDNYTFHHSVSVCALMVSFGRSLGLDRDTIHHVGIGGLLHDLGKVMVPDAILNKPGRLTDDEWRVMKGHVAEGCRVLAETPSISDTAMRVAAEHHERHDGSGYPKGLAGDAISRVGQMAAICDVYDAITSDRCYHRGLPATDALRKVFEWSRFHFSPDMVHAFLRSTGIYPAGSLVMLESGRLAVVVSQGNKNLLQPTVRVIYHARNQHYLQPENLDLAKPLGFGGGDRITGHESPERWGIDPMRFL
jgi:HD-GYP domain-containing protein (c-di-GMP phosphodiesterase class II)